MARFVRPLLLALVLAPATSALAQEGAADARRLFQEGLRLAEAERWGEAAEAFERSVRLVERPSTLLNLALTYDRLGRYVEAIALWERLLSRVPPEDGRRAAIEAALEEDRRRVASLRVALDPPEASLRVDGAPAQGGVVLRLDPGAHRIRAEAEGHAAAELRVSLSAGALRDLAVRLEPLVEAGPAADPRTPRDPPGSVEPAAVALLVGGGLVLAESAVLLAVGLVFRDEVEAAEGVPWTEVSQRADLAPVLQGVGIGGLAVGAVAAGLGLVLLLTEGAAPTADRRGLALRF